MIHCNLSLSCTLINFSRKMAELDRLQKEFNLYKISKYNSHTSVLIITVSSSPDLIRASRISGDPEHHKFNQVDMRWSR